MEILESDTPLIVEKRELVMDSGGIGHMKGGLGRRMIFRIPDDAYAPLPPVNLGIQSGRHQYAPEGLFGGGEGAKAAFLINGKPGNPYGLSQLKPGDVVSMDAAGGGGYGDPLEREVDRVERDVREGYVSMDAAMNSYGVVIDSATGLADAMATEKKRETMRADQKTSF